MNKVPDSNEKTPQVASKPGRSAARKVVWKEHAVQLDVLRSEVERVHIVDTDFVILLKSKRRVLLRDGALKSATMDEFAIEFSDETIAGKTFFAMAEPLPASFEAWSDVDDGMSLEQAAVPDQPAPLIEPAKPEPTPAPAPLPQDKGSWSSTMMYAAGGGLLLAVAAAGQSKKNELAPVVSTKLGIEGATGPLIGQQLVKVYGQDGTLLTTGVMEDGKVNIALPKGYSGPVMLVLADTNGGNPDYVSENTGEKLSLGAQQLRAMAVIPAGAENFAVSITPITELAVQLAIAKNQLVAMDHWSQQALSAQVVQDNNAAVAKALGLENVLGAFTTIIDGTGQKNIKFVESDGLSAAEKYGHFLAVLSASDSVSGSIDKTLAAYLVQLIGADDAAAKELQQMWIQGAKTFELGNMAGFANLPMPQLGQRELLKPSLLTRWAAQTHIQADDNTALSQGELMLQSGATPVLFPVALPSSSLAGDQLVLFVEGQGAKLTLTLSQADVAAGVTHLSLSPTWWAQSGVGQWRIMARVTGPDGQDSGEYLAYELHAGQLRVDSKVSQFAQQHDLALQPDVADFAAMGVDVQPSHLGLLQSVLLTEAVGAPQVANNALLQGVVSAVQAVLAMQGSTTSPNVQEPTAAQYALMGVTGVDTPAKARLMASVLHAKPAASVDQVAPLQVLADAVSAVMLGVASGVAPTLAQWTQLGVTGISLHNLEQVGVVLAASAKDGTGADTLAELQAIAQAGVLQAKLKAQTIIVAYADNNAGTPPSLADYTNAEVTGVTSDNLDAVNSALASAEVSGQDVNSPAKLQFVVNAWESILALADGQTNTAQASLPAPENYRLIGVTGVDGAASARLLGDVLDAKNRAVVDSVGEIQPLASAAAAVMSGAQGLTPPTLDQLLALGLTGVMPTNLSAVQKAIADSADSGSDVDTLEKLQTLVNASAGSSTVAFGVIVSYAQLNSGQVPTVSDFVSIGAAGVNEQNLPAILSALRSATVTGSSVDTVVKVDALVSAYQSILNLANGADDTPTTRNPGAAAYGLIGVTGVDSPSQASLLGDAIDIKSPADVGAVPDIQTLADAAAAVLRGAARGTPPSLVQLNSLGVSGVTEGNLTAVQNAIAQTAQDGSGVDSLSELQQVVDAARQGSEQALGVIRAYAQTHSGTVPTVQTYADAGAADVTADNLDSINSALASAAVTGDSVATLSQVQALVQAFNRLRSLADGQDNTPSAGNPDAASYALLGVEGVDAGNSRIYKARLLGDVLDLKALTDMDSVVKLQGLANVVATVVGAAGGGTAPSLAQLQSLGLQDLSADNMPAVVAAIANTADDGEGVSTLVQLQALVTQASGAAASALQVIAAYAQNNGGTVPTLMHYNQAGVSGVSLGHLDALNDALASATVTAASVDSTLKLQALVDTYLAILQLADGQNNTDSTQTPAAESYARVGVVGVDSAGQARLLGDVLDLQTPSAVDRVPKIQVLADAAKAVLTGAQGGAVPTLAQLHALGVQSLDANNIVAVQDAIAASDAEQVSTLEGLQAVVNSAAGAASVALTAIRAYAQDNGASAPAPTEVQYRAAGVTGVNATHLDSINSALASASVDADSVSSTAKLQALVNAFQSVLRLADGLDNTPTTDNPTNSAYGLIGVTGVDSAAKASLLGDVLDLQQPQNASLVPSIQTLADAATAVVQGAAGQQAPTLAQLQALGVNQVTADNLPAIARAIAATPDNGSGVNTLQKLQTLVTEAANEAANALQIIQAYAQDNRGTAPTLNDFARAGVAGVTGLNLAFVNDALASDTVTGASVGTTAQVQDLVQASLAVQNLADGLDNTPTAANPTQGQYSLVGVSGVDSPFKARLLGDVLDIQQPSDADTVDKIQNLAESVHAVMRTAAAGAPVSLQQLLSLRLVGLSADNLVAVQNAIANTRDDGQDLDTLQKLQALVNSAVGARAAALAIIGDYAEQNLVSAPATPMGQAPTLQDYVNAGVSGVQAGNLSFLNDALATAAVTRASVDSTGKVQALVQAYSGILALADGGVATGTPVSASAYALLGLTGVNTGSEAAVKAELLSSVIDGKTTADVDTVAKIQALANAAAAVISAAAGSEAPTLAQLQALGVSAVNADNLPVVLRAIADTADDGSGVRTLGQLQSVSTQAIDTANSALQVISSYAQTNTGTAPTLVHYSQAGVTGANADNLASLNDALASANVQGTSVDSTPKLQALVNAYQAILALADGVDNTANTNNPAAAQYALVGVSGINSPVKTSLLGDVIDGMSQTGVNTVPKLQTLADAVAAVMSGAANATGPSLAQWQALGVTGVNADNLQAVQDKLAATADDGSAVDTLVELQNLVNSAQTGAAAALIVIRAYAENNTGLVPTADDYANAGVVGVNPGNLARINSALASPTVVGASVDTRAKVQALVDASQAIFGLADGINNTATAANSDMGAYGLIGVTGVDSAVKASLLGDVLDTRTSESVPTVVEVQQLANAVAAVVATAALSHASAGATLSMAQLQLLGLNGVTADNLPAIVNAIALSADDASAVATADALQSLVLNAANAAASALQVIGNYAENNSGPIPSVDDYALAGVGGVTAGNVSSINDALASASVNAASVATTTQVQDLVNAYNRVLTMADGQDNTAHGANPSAAEYALMGVTGVDSAPKTGLLGDVIDLKAQAEVDTVQDIQALADAVAAVMAGAAGVAAPTLAQLATLGLTSVNQDNLKAVQEAIAATANDGSGVASLSALQAVVASAAGDVAGALGIIISYAQNNSGPAPALQHYRNAAVSGVTPENLAAINSALASDPVVGTRVDTTAKVQALVDAYLSVLQLADGQAGSGPALGATPYSLIGVSGLDLTASTAADYKQALIHSVVDLRTADQVDTLSEINNLVKIANAIQELAAGQTPSHTLQAPDFAAIGVTGVSQANLSQVLQAIGVAQASGADSVGKLQALVHNALSLVLTGIDADTGVSATDRITRDNTLTFHGTSSAADDTSVRVTLQASSGTSKTLWATVQGGVWRAVDTAGPLPDGVYTVDVALVNGQQQVIRSAPPSSITIDTSASALPDGTADTALGGHTITLDAISPDTGASSTDFMTNTGRLVFSGTSTAPNGTHVALNIAGVVVYTQVNSGLWSVDHTAHNLANGPHNVSVALVDAAGNAVDSDQQLVVIDNSAVRITSKTTGSIASTADLVLYFSDDITAQSGKFIRIVDESTNTEFEAISVTDSTRVTVLGNTVTLNPSADLVVGKTYHATIDSGAFQSSAATFDGLSSPTDWTFRPVDASTSVNWAGVGVQASNGIRATELSALEVSGTLISANIGSVTNPVITAITFMADDGSSFAITSGLPSIDPATRSWTLAHHASWVSQLVSGKSYTVSVDLSAQINSVPTTTTAQGPTTLIDSTEPTLSITSSATQLKAGESATLTFSFSEAPVGFASSDIDHPHGSLTGFAVTADPKVYTAVFTPHINLSGSFVPVSVSAGVYGDAVGNPGGAASAPQLAIDTQIPSVQSSAISGADSTGAPKSGDLVTGDRLRVTLTLSEATTVTGTPTWGLDVGGVSKSATYVSGSGTNTLVFEYTIATGDNDLAGGITAAADALTLADAVLQDAAGNTADTRTAAITAGSNSVRVDTTATALQTLQNAAQNNSASGVTTSVSVYTRAGVSGVSSDNLDALNSALNSAGVTGADVSTTAQVQGVVDAWNGVLSLADGGTSKGAPVTAAQWRQIGVAGVDSVTPGASAVSAASKARLLSDTVDNLARASADSVDELQSLAQAVQAVMVGAAGGTAPTRAHLQTLGITGVTDANLSAVQAAIAATPDTGASVDSREGLQFVVTSAVNATTALALAHISGYAGDNVVSAPAAPRGTPPSLTDYANANVTGVTADNLAQINDALATALVTRAASDTTAKLQAIVDAYAAVRLMADGVAGNASPVSALQLGLIGAEIGTASAKASHLALLNNVLDQQAPTGVDTVAEITALAQITSAIQTHVAGGTPTHTLQASDFARIGLSGVTPGVLGALMDSLALKPDDGSGTDTLPKLQKLIDTVNAPALTLALTQDTGTSAEDGITSDITIGFGGNLLADGTRYYSVDGGAYSTTYTAPTTQGAHSVSVKQIDSAGNSGQVSTLNFVFDSVAPTVSISGQQLSDDTGASASDWVTHVAVQTIRATLSSNLAVGDTLFGSVDNGSTWVQVPSPAISGTSITWQGVSLSGSSTVLFQVRDLAGNMGSPMGARAYVLDTTAPTVSVSGVQLSDDTGASFTDLVTRSAAQTITATLSHNLAVGDTLLGSIDGGSTWSDITPKVIGRDIAWDGVTLSSAVSTPQIVFKVMDLAGNTGSHTGARTYTLDTTAPDLRISGIDISSDTGTLDTDFVTRDATQTITATLSANLAAGDILWGSVNGGSSWIDITHAVSATAITWSAANLTAGGTIAFKVSDLAGNHSPTLATQAYVLDTSAPTQTISGVRLSDDTGANGQSNSDFVTSQASQQAITATLSAALLGSDILQGSVDNGTTWVDITSQVNGTRISWADANLSPGQNTISFRLVDLAGNTGQVTGVQSYTLDTQSPSTAIASVAFSASTDGLTLNTPAQDLNGSLSAPLASGETVYVSLNDGGTWLTANAAVGDSAWSLSGLNITSSGHLRVKVTDLAGNDGEVLRSLYTYDTDASSTTVTAISFSDDSGVSPSDLITKIAAQVVSGALSAPLEQGEKVEISLNGGLNWRTANATVGTSAWSLDGVTLSGTGSVLAKVTDAAGNSGLVISRPYALDQVAPTSTVIGISLSQDTAPNGATNSDLVTRVASQTLSGTLSANLAAGELVQVSLDNGLSWKTASIGVGQSTWSLSNVTLTGSNTLQVKVTDLAGNDGTPSSRDYVFDITRPTNQLSNVAFNNDTGVSANDFITSEPQQTITARLSAMLLPDEKVFGSLDGGTNWVDLSDKISGLDLTWDGVTLTQSGTLMLKVSDAAGNDGEPFSQGYTLETATPANRFTQLSLLNDTGISNTDFITNASSQVISGTLSQVLPAGAKVWGRLKNSGDWLNLTDMVTGTSLLWTGVVLSGTNEIQLRVQNAAGIDGPLHRQTFVLDTTLPTTEVASISLMHDSAPNGGTNRDFVTKTSAQVVFGTLGANLAADEKVFVSWQAGQWTAASATPGQNTWSLSGVSLTGSGSLKVKVMDTAGNSGPERSQAYEFDNVAPTTEVLSIRLSVDTAPNNEVDTPASSDFKTRMPAQTISGTLSRGLLSGDSVYVSLDNGDSWLKASATVGSTAWSLAGVALAGSNSLLVKVSDTAGNDGPISRRDYVLDLTPPTVSIGSVSFSADTGASNSDFITSLADQTILATLSASPGTGEVLYGSLDNGTTWTDLSNFLSSTALSWTGVRLSGSNTLRLKVTDQVGNDGPVFSQTYSLVSGGPAAAVFSASLSADTAVNNTTNNDFVTRTALQDLSGTLTANLLAGDTVQVSLDGGTSWLDATAATGANTWRLDGITLPGSFTLKARVINSSGVNSTEFTRAITLDTEAPTTASGIPTFSSDTAPHGAFNSDRVTSSPAQTMEGQLTAPLLSGETVQVSLDAGGTWQAANIAVGQTLWRLPGVTLTGSGVMHVKVSDLAGNQGPIEIRPYTLDTTRPGIVVYNPSLSDDTAPNGTSNSDFVTKTANQTLTATLTGVPASDERLYGSLDNGTTWTDLSAYLSGTTLTWTGLSLSGTNVLQLKVTDSAGNDGAVLSRTYKIDQTIPSTTVDGLSLSQDTAANGQSNSDFVTRTAAQTISAVLSSALQDGEKLYGSLNNGQSWTDLSSLLSGNTLTWSGVTLSGSNTLRLKVTDPAGNDGTVTSQTYTVDQTPPTTRMASASFSADTGPHNTSNGDFVTRQAGQTLSGTLSANLTAGETVFVSMDNGTSWTAATTTVGQNTWSLTGLTLSGTNTFKVKVSDQAGNDGLVFSEIYELDTTVPTAQVATVTFSNDTGTAGDLNTTVASQTISGTLSAALGANETVYVSLNNGSTWRMATANAGDTSWSLEGITLTGSNTLHAKVADKAGNESTPLQRAYVFDSLLPTVSISAVSFSADTAANGTTNADFVTLTRSQTIRATLSAMPESDEALWGSLDGGTNWVDLSASLSPTANGASLSWNTTLSGSGTLQLQVKDVRGNHGPLYSQDFVLDEQGPVTTVATAAFSVDTGTPGDFNTTEDDQTISGTLSAVLAAGEAVYVSLDNGSNWQQASTLVGSIAWRLEGVKLTGSNTLKVKVTDQAGNNGTVLEQDYVLNNAVPTGTWSALAFSADTAPTGSSNNDFVTQTAAQTISATLSEPLGTQKQVWGSLDNGSSWTDITATVNGTSLSWAVTLSASSTLRIQLRDVGGNVGNEITQAYVLDTTAPSKAMASIALSNDTGTPGDFITTNPSQTISGTLTANLAEGEQVYVSINNGTTWQLASATVGTNSWSLGNQTLSGSGTLKVKVTDLAGNDGAVLSQDFVINSAPPTATITSVSFTADTAPHGGSNTDLVTRTATQVVFGTLSANLASGEAVYVSLDGGATFIAASGAAGQNTWSLSGVTLNNGSQDMLLEVRNLSGNAGPGRTQAYVLDTDAPTTTVATASLGNDSGTSASDGVTRFATQNLSGTLSGNLQAGDTVYVSLDNGSTWQTATASVGSPHWSLASATLVAGSTVLVKVGDAAGNQTASLPLTYTLDTDAPTTTIATAAFSADTAPANGSNSDFVTRTAAQTVSGTLSANLASGERVLVSLDNGTSWLAATTTVGQASWSLASQTLAGSNTLRVKVQDLAGNDGPVRTEVYTLDTNAPVTLSDLTITPAGGRVEVNALNKTNTALILSAAIGANEATGGVAHFFVGNTLVGADNDIAAGDTQVIYSASYAQSSGLQAAITAGGVFSVKLYDKAGNLLSLNGPTLAVRYNDAPVLDASKTPVLPSVDTTNASASPVGAVGTLLSTLVGRTGMANVSDVDSGNPVGVAIPMNYDTSKGTLFYSTNGGANWQAWTDTSGKQLHLVADANTRLYFKANAGAVGDAGLRFRAWDQSNGLANGAIESVSNYGGSYAYSLMPDSIDLALFTRAYTPTGLSKVVTSWRALLANIGNFNGDGFMDVGIVTLSDYTLPIFSGKAGATLSSSAETSTYISQTNGNGTMTDLNGDGYADLLVGNFNDTAVNPNGSTATTPPSGDGRFLGFLLGGTSTGARTDETQLTTAYKPIIGKGSGDFNGDGFEDVLMSNAVNAGTSGGTVTMLQGDANPANGMSTQATYNMGTGFGVVHTSNTFHGGGISWLGDTNRDGLADLAISNNTTGQVVVKLGTTSTAGWAAVVNNSTGWTVSGLTANQTISGNGPSLVGVNVASAGDVNGDGLGDLLVMDPGGLAAYVIYGQANGSQTNINVASLTQAQGFRVSVSSAAWMFGSGGGSVGDVNADGYDDLVIGASGMTTQGGAVLVLGGATLTHGNLDNVDTTNAAGWARTIDVASFDATRRAMGYDVGSTSGDVNGDGLGDFVMLSMDGTGGGSLLVYGDTQMGAGLNMNPLIQDSLATGTSAAERLLGTSGADVLVGGGGADAISAGAGNDRVIVRDTSFVRVDGGLGNDIFKLDSSASGLNLDLSANGLGGRIRGFESIDITGGGNNTLKLTLQDVLALPDAVNTSVTSYNEARLLLVAGNAGDVLQINNTGSLNPGTWSDATPLSAADKSALAGAGYAIDNSRAYNVYTNGIAALIVDTLVTYQGV